MGEKTLLKSPSTQKYVFLLLPTVGCLSFTVQNDVCAEFNTRRLFSSAEGGNFLCAQRKSEYEDEPMSMICDITTRLEANCGPV